MTVASNARTSVKALSFCAVGVLSLLALSSCATYSENMARTINKYEYPTVPGGYGRLLFYGSAYPFTAEDDYCHVSVDGQPVRNPRKVKSGFFFVDVPTGVHELRTVWNPIAESEISIGDFDEMFGERDYRESSKSVVSIGDGQILDVHLMVYPAGPRCEPIANEEHDWGAKYNQFMPLPPAPPSADFITYQ